ncbi:MAG: CcdB family protein [Pseudomonadota bacterium]
MRQFDVIENPSSRSRAYAPYLVVLQSHHLAPLDSIVLAPVIRDAARPLTPLDVSVDIAGERLLVALSELASVSRHSLGKALASLEDQEYDLHRALDRLFTGF